MQGSEAAETKSSVNFGEIYEGVGVETPFSAWPFVCSNPPIGIDSVCFVLS